MKKDLILTCAALSLFAAFAPNRASAQVLANDEAGVYSTWISGTNFGLGFEPWVLEQTGTGGGSFTGFFLGAGGDPVASTNGQVWGIYANGAGTPASEAFRALSNSLPVNATFKILWHNKGIGFSTGNVGGFNLRTGNNTNLQNAASFLSDGSVFAMYYIGGNSDNYVVYDGNGVNTIPIGFNGGSAGLQVDVTLLSGSMYNLIVKNAAGTQVLWSTNAQPLVTSGTIDSVALYNFDASGDQNFNKMQILYGPPQIENLTPANGSVYVPAGSQLSFAAVSTASIINSNGISLTLNGILQTNNAWTVIGSGTSSNQVVLNTPLQANLVYNGTIVATDTNGNSSVTTFSFDTWLTAPNNLYIEAADYNYGGGQYVLNTAINQPNQVYGQNDLLGMQNIDYLIFNTAGTNNAYRAGDLPDTEAATDVDHNNFAANGFTPYDLDFNVNGQWEDYTRQLSNNVTYAVYARMAGFNANPSMSLERMATAQVSTTNQPGAVVGTFICPQTGGTQNYTFVPLTDFFSNPVLINSGGTNTFRITDIGGSGAYNVSYLLFVATTNTATLRPNITAGYPYPGAQNAGPEQLVSFTIANAQTSVNPASIQLFLNSSNLTSMLTLSNNAAGTLVSYQPAFPNLLPGGTNTARVIYSDGSVSITNTWQFTVQTLPVLPTAWAMPMSSSFLRGFSEQIAKGDDSATNTDFPPSVARAEAQLAGTLTNSQTGLPYANEALNGGVNIETNTINYAIDSSFTALFTPIAAFPDVPAGTTNNVAMAAQMYVQLSPGVYNFNVYSDDGFKFTAGSTPANTNMILGMVDAGRAPTSTQFSFIVATNGLYPMRLLYFKAQLGGGGVELYSVNATNGASVLLNDPNNAGSVKVYYQVPAVTLSIAHSGNNVVLSWTAPGYSLQSASVLTGPYTTINSATSPYTVPATGAQQYFRLVQSQ